MLYGVIQKIKVAQFFETQCIAEVAYARSPGTDS